MTKLFLRDYRDIIEYERTLTDWPVPVLPAVIGWDKAPWWLKAVDFTVGKCTAGRINMKANYSVMINDIIVTPDPDKMHLSTYFHECWHYLQIREAGGWFIFLMKYFFLPLPVLWTFRSRAEWEAYAISSWVEGVEALSPEYRKSGKQYTLSVGSQLFNDLVVNKFNRKYLKNIFFSVAYLYMDIHWDTRAGKFEIVRPEYFFKKNDTQCIIKVPWRGEDEYTPAMKGLYQLMHRVLTRY